jgi:CheY-like chemotaxis protein
MTGKILIIEDDEELQELYVNMLDQVDCEIVQAYDGGEGLEKLTADTPDVIVLDIILDEMMGDELFAKLKQDPRYADIPIVVVSVLPIERCKHLLEMDPRTVFLRKPFRRAELLEAIEKACTH